MKKLILILAVALSSCGPSREELYTKGEIDKYGHRIETNPNQKIVATYRQVFNGITMHVIDSCEYIVVCDNGVSIIHKQNCIFCKARK